MFELVTLLVFVAAFLVVFAVNSVLTDLFPTDRKAVAERLRDDSRKRQRLRAQEASVFRDPNQFTSDLFLSEEVETGRIYWLKTIVEQSGLDITVERVVTIGIGLGLLLAVILGFATGPLAIVPGAAFGFCLPWLYVNWRRKRRTEKLLSQMPDAFDLMGRVMRAGQTISHAMKAVAEEFDPPVSEEFGYCYEQQNLGLDAESAMRDLSRRTGLLEMKIFAMALLVHRQTGGNLAELLDKLSSIVRDRFRIRGLVRTLTAEGRVQAGVLIALPFVAYVIMLLLNSKYALILFDHPILPIGSLCSLALGWFWIRKIVNIDA